MKSLTYTRGVALSVALALTCAQPALAIVAPASTLIPAGKRLSGLAHHHRHLAPLTISNQQLAAQSGENTKLNLGGATGGATHAASSGTSASIIRTLVALLVVIAVIYGISWILKQFRAGRSRATGTGLDQVASLPLGNGRSVSLVKVGNELVLLGVAEQSVTALRHYSEADAVAAGIALDELLAETRPDSQPARSSGSRLRTGTRPASSAVTASSRREPLQRPSVRDVGRRMLDQARERTVRQ